MGRSRGAPAPARSSSAAASRPKPAASSPPPPASSTSSSGWGSAPRPSAPAPMHASGPAPPPAMQPSSSGGGMFSGLMGSVVTGAAMGTGSAIAHRAVDSFMGPRTVVHDHQGGAAPAPAAPMAMGAAAPTQDGPCGGNVKAFADCMSRANGDMNACSEYFNAMQQCKFNYNLA